MLLNTGENDHAALFNCFLPVMFLFWWCFRYLSGYFGLCVFLLSLGNQARARNGVRPCTICIFSRYIVFIPRNPAGFGFQAHLWTGPCNEELAARKISTKVFPQRGATATTSKAGDSGKDIDTEAMLSVSGRHQTGGGRGNGDSRSGANKYRG